MHGTYRIREDDLYDEQGRMWTVYGIEAIDGRGDILACFADLFFDRGSAWAFVCLCNEQQVELLHLPEIIDNVLAEQYGL